MDYARLHRGGIDFVKRDTADRDDRLLQRTRLRAVDAYALAPEDRLDGKPRRLQVRPPAQVVLDEPLAVVDCRAAEAERLAVDFAPVFVQRFAVTGNHPRARVLEALSGAARDARVGRLKTDQPRTVRNEAMSEPSCEALSIAYRAKLGIADAAGRQQDVLGAEGKVPGRHDKTRLHVFDPHDWAIRDNRHAAFAQQIPECMDNRRCLAVRREHPSVLHAPKPHAQRLEARDDLARRTLAHGLRDERRGRADVGEELVGGDVLREVAATVGGHQHLRPQPRLALDDNAGDLALRSNGRGEHASRAPADNRQSHRRLPDCRIHATNTRLPWQGQWRGWRRRRRRRARRARCGRECPARSRTWRRGRPAHTTAAWGSGRARA